ncbi:MAG: hypothetical protein Q4E36_02845 [Bacillota bacterium]|nr:hypothetical protein [Bacillota bacterium]
MDKSFQSPEEKQAYVRDLDESDFVQVGDSNYYLVQIDKALGSSYLYYFLEKDQGKISYIKDFVGYPAFIGGQVQGEKILLSFQDSNGKISH